MTSLRAGRPGNRTSVPRRDVDSSLPSLVRPAVAPVSCAVNAGGAKRSGCETTSRSHLVLKIRKGLRYTCTHLYVHHSWLGAWLDQHVWPLVYHLPEDLCSHPVIVLFLHDFHVIFQNLCTVCYSLTNTVKKVSLNEPILTHSRLFTRSYFTYLVQ